MLPRLPAAGALAVALILAGGTAGAATPDIELLVYPSLTQPGRAVDIEIDVTVGPSDAATTAVTLFVPSGYGLDLSASPGSILGSARVQLEDASASILTATGSLLAADPATLPALGCAPADHQAAWNLRLYGTPAPLELTVFADATDGEETALGAYRLRVCLGAGEVRLRSMAINIAGVFTNPPQPGEYAWRALASPSAGGQVVEARAIVPLPHVLTVKATYDRRAQALIVSGTLGAAGRPREDVNVRLRVGGRPETRGMKPLGVVATTPAGRFSFRKRIERRFLPDQVFVLAFVNPYVGNCPRPSTAPASCASESLSPPASILTRVALPPKR
jgi:hypothetical protein